DQMIILWDAGSGTIVRELEGHTNAVSSVEFSADGTTLLSSSRDGTLRLWDVASGNNLRVFGTRSELLFDAAFATDDRLVVDSTMRVWDAGSGALVAQFDGPTAGVQSLDVSPDGTLLVTGALDDPLVRVWNVVSRTP